MKWISVKDKLPEDQGVMNYDLFLVYGADEENEGFVRVAAFFDKGNEPHKYWWHLGIEGAMQGVSHWVPIDNYPKDDDEVD